MSVEELQYYCQSIFFFLVFFLFYIAPKQFARATLLKKQFDTVNKIIMKLESILEENVAKIEKLANKFEKKVKANEILLKAEAVSDSYLVCKVENFK